MKMDVSFFKSSTIRKIYNIQPFFIIRTKINYKYVLRGKKIEICIRNMCDQS